MHPAKDMLRRVWSWTRSRLTDAGEWLRYWWEALCCCAFCYVDKEDENDIEKGPYSSQQSQKMSTGAAAGTIGGGNAGNAAGQVHKVIMVGSGGVGKSALTLQFMYDEVRFFFKIHFSQ